MIRCTVAHVDLQALEANFRAITGFLVQRSAGMRAHSDSGPAEGVQALARRTPPGLIAVVKANAYGHGAGPVGRALEDAGATMLACADIEEAIVLREAGVGAEILVFGALSVSDLAGIFEYRLTPTISTPSAGRAVQAAAAARHARVRYHLKIDTGLNRLGFRHDNLRNTLPELLASPNLDLDAVYTHFATSDAEEQPPGPETEETPADSHAPVWRLFEIQRLRFDIALDELASLGARPRVRHAANSAAILRDPRVWFDYVRPGILLYGIKPGASLVSGSPEVRESGSQTSDFRTSGLSDVPTSLTLAPVMSLRSRVVAVKGVRSGEPVGYGARFTATRPTVIATVPAGYADGLDLRLAGRGSVLIAGRRAPIVGSVCMDMISIDVTGIPVETGDVVTILGRDGHDEISVQEMADAIGTIPYEILCRIGTRIERVYN